MRTVTQGEMKKLFKHGIIKHTHKGIVNSQGVPTGFNKTKTNCYIENKYVDMARELK